MLLAETKCIWINVDQGYMLIKAICIAFLRNDKQIYLIYQLFVNELNGLVIYINQKNDLFQNFILTYIVST